ncbi:retrovirus-related pol polyprotein from transposon TNT 1-94 [Tanacetum coccineum]
MSILDQVMISYLVSKFKNLNIAQTASPRRIPQAYVKAVSSNPHLHNLNGPPRQDSFTFQKRVRLDPQPQELETSFEARERDYMAAYTERMEREEARHLITKHVNSISLIRMEEEKSVEKQRAAVDTIMGQFGVFEKEISSREKSKMEGEAYHSLLVEPMRKAMLKKMITKKEDMRETFKIYKAEVENQRGKKIQILRSDRGGEYFSTEFSSYCESHGLIHQRTTPYTPQQNGVAERKNRVLQDMINAMLVSANLPKNLWGEALLTACHVSNRIIAKKLKVSPYEIWKGRKPNISYFRVWGCLAYYKVPLPNTSKLGPRGLKSVFVGYAKDSKSYRCLDLDSNVIVESRDVDFFENKFRHDSTSTNEIVTQIPQDISGPNLNSNNKRNMAESSSAPRISERARMERNLDPDFIDSQAIIFLVEGNVINKIPVLLNVEDAPKTYKEAITSRNSAFWKEAIDDEMDSLVSNNTWELSDLPPGSKAIGCRWVFRIKYHTDGSIQTFKARLVIQGFSQRQGVDYFDTYAPVARITSIRVLFALASIYNLPIHQMDVKTAFLNGDLDEEVYMKQPEGFVLPGHENKVCKLKKSLYGLKQAPKQWHDKFDMSVLSNGFTHNSSDRCIYSKFTKDYGVILCLYVDDILIVGTNIEGINETKKFLSSCFQMKDMNEVDTILGIKVKRHSGGYALNQCHYIDKIIDKFQHLNIEEANTPYESSCKLVENNGRVVAQIEYASAIGCLMYATHCTRPDIAYAVCKLSRYTSNPSQDHWKAIGRIFGYLKRTRKLALHYDRFPAVLEGYSDASWITGSSDSKSTTGWIFTLGGGAVCWGSKKQTCITHSTMEAEFLALAAAGKEAEWLRNMLLDIELWPQPMPAISLHCDSQSTLSRAYNNVYNGKSRHISLRHAYIKELISNGIITIEYIHSCKNLADPFIKGLPKDIGFTYVDIRSGAAPTKVSFTFGDICDNCGLSRLHNQSIERDHLIGIGFMLDFVEFISFNFGDKEMILVIEAVSR